MVLVNECYQLLCPTCVTPSVRLSVCLSVTKFMLPSKTNQLSRNSTADLSLSRNSRGAEHLSRNSRGVEDLSRNSRGGQRSQGSVQGLRPHRIHPLCVHARCFCSVARKKSIPSIRALAFSFFSDINRHHFSSVSELEAEGEPCR